MGKFRFCNTVHYHLIETYFHISIYPRLSFVHFQISEIEGRLNSDFLVPPPPQSVHNAGHRKLTENSVCIHKRNMPFD